VNADTEIERGAVEVKLGVYKDLEGTRRVDLIADWSTGDAEERATAE
jgi:hypothetical protein